MGLAIHRDFIAYGSWSDNIAGAFWCFKAQRWLCPWLCPDL